MSDRPLLYSARLRHAVALLLLLLALVTFTGLAARAQGGNAWQVPWWTVDAGGGSSSGGGFRLSGTAGQPDAGPPLHGGAYTLSGGYWTARDVASHTLYLPLIRR